jgi:hypothetical protein
MRIGVSVRGGRNHDFWRDVASQHAICLAAALRRLPFVENVLLIDVGGTCQLPQAAISAAPGLTIVTQHQASDAVDVIIELAAGLDRAWLDLMHSRARKLIRCRSGSPLQADDALPAASPSSADGARQTDWYDELWLLPKDALAVPLMRTQYRCPVRVVPFVWTPMFVERRVAELQARGVQFGYQVANAQSAEACTGWRIAVDEPDRPAASEPGIAMLACEDAYRTRPDAVRALHVLNATPMNAAPRRARLAATFELVREHRTTFHGRHDFVEFVGRHADAVFVHQQHDADAYGCLDVLYGDYPLIHNLPWLLGAGYYYPGDDAQQGARVLLAALHGHDATLDAYRARSRVVFAAVDPFSEANLTMYSDALLSPP